jgi:recombination protein RecT
MNAPTKQPVAQQQVAVAHAAADTPMKLSEELESRTAQFAGSLPAHIPVERFKKVIIAAVNSTPALLKADRRTFFNSAMKAANDGLLPDGREGALVIYKTKTKEIVNGKEQERWIDAVQWMPMIAGIRKKVRNSGEIATWDAHVVYAKDEFDYELGLSVHQAQAVS